MTEEQKPRIFAGQEQANAQLIALIQNAWDLIAFAKTQQWRAAYYSLLWFAAIVGVLQSLRPDHEPPWGAGVSAGAALIGVVVGIWTIWDSFIAQRKARGRIVRCAAHFSDEFPSAWERPKRFEESCYGILYPLGLTITTVIGFAVAVWIALCF